MTIGSQAMDVGVCHCVELSNSISQTLDGIFDHFKSLELSPGHGQWIHWDPESSWSPPGCSRNSQSSWPLEKIGSKSTQNTTPNYLWLSKTQVRFRWLFHDDPRITPGDSLTLKWPKNGLKLPQNDLKSQDDSRWFRMTPGWVRMMVRSKGQGGLILSRFYSSKLLAFPVLGHKKGPSFKHSIYTFEKNTPCVH